MATSTDGSQGCTNLLPREMEQTVLAGIIGYGAELYIDDCIVYGPTEEELLSNLEGGILAIQGI